VASRADVSTAPVAVGVAAARPSRVHELDGRDETPKSAARELPGRSMEVQTDGKPKPTSQRNFTDPQSSIMPGRHGFIQAYNCQAAVDGAHQIIVAADVTAQSVDNALLKPMVEQIENNAASRPTVVLADNGYWNPRIIEKVEAMGVEVLVAVQRDKHGVAATTSVGPMPDNLSPRDRMRWRLNTPEGRAHYARRKAVVEPVFGQIRVGQRFNRLSLRGLAASRSEWRLLAACHNSSSSSA
jgi:hypothetical protein